MTAKQQKPGQKLVKIYLTEWCPFCIRARQILDQNSVAYEVIDVDGDRETRAWLRQATGQGTVPQLFFGEESVGGCNELEAIVRGGDLQARIAA